MSVDELQVALATIGCVYASNLCELRGWSFWVGIACVVALFALAFVEVVP